MTESITFTIPGSPVGKGRPRFARRGAFVSTYIDAKTASYENLVKLAAKQAMNGANPFQSAVSAEIMLRVTPPASWSQKKRTAAFSGEIRPTSKPDIDNCCKGIFDAMNGIVFLDDKQVVELCARKEYASQAEAVVQVRGLSLA